MQGKLAWTFAITTIALFMTALDNLVVVTALPQIQKDLGASLTAARVGRERLHADLCRAPADGRGARRPLRAQAPLRHRPLDLHGRLRDRRALDRHRDADRRPRDPGPGRRDRDAAHADDPRGGHAAREARRDPRRVGRDRRPRRRDRPDRRRCAHRPGSPGSGSSGSTSRSASSRSRSRGSTCARRRARRTSSTSRARRRGRRAVLHRLGRRPLEHARLGLDRGARLHRRRHRDHGRVRLDRGALEGADAAAPLLPQPRVLGRERRLGGDVLRHVRLDLPADPVPADRSGLHGARRRPAHARVDRGDDVRRAGRRHDVGPDRRPAADGARARAAGDRARVAGGDRDADRPVLAPRRPVHHRGHRHGPLLRAGRERRPLGGGPEEEGQASGANNALREIGGVFGIAVLAAIFANQGGYVTAEPSWTASSPRVWVGAVVVGIGAVVCLFIPASSPRRRVRRRAIGRQRVARAASGRGRASGRLPATRPRPARDSS